MISNSIQELFDGTLSDEQTAELLHSLSVSPEKRLDFRRHMALQGAMQRDRAASALTSEEDDAIWGALAGLGAASTVGGAAANYAGGFAKVLSFVLVGVAGYLLGSNTLVDFFGNDGAATNVPAGGPPVTSAAPQLNNGSAGTRPAAGTGAPAGNGQPAAGNGTAAAAATGTEAPRVIYRDRIVYRESSGETNASGTGTIARRNTTLSGTAPEASGNGTQQIGGSENGNSGNGGSQNGNARNSGGQNAGTPSTPPVTLPATSEGTNASQRSGNDSAGSTPQASIAPQNNKPLDPKVAFQQSDGDQKSPMEENTPISSLWKNGLEISYGEYLGILSGQLVADNADEIDPHYYSRHMDLTYRFNEGRFGIGARLGYGTFSRVSLYLDYNVRTGAGGDVNRIDSIYRVRVQPEKQALLEFLVNYRLPVTSNLGVGLEASWGQSAVHTEAGGSFIVHWLLTDHIGLQAGGGINKYWYSYIGQQREQLLEGGGNGMSISDKAADSYTGTSFEARYGIFYHF